MTEAEINEEIRDRIGAVMRHERITQNEVARRADIRPATLSNFLSGKSGITLGTLVALCDGIGFEVRIEIEPKP